jgi:hypothetical protein
VRNILTQKTSAAQVFRANVASTRSRTSAAVSRRTAGSDKRGLVSRADSQRGAGARSSSAAPLLRLANDTSVIRDGPHPPAELGAVAARCKHRHSRRPCHPHAIRSGSSGIPRTTTVTPRSRLRWVPASDLGYLRGPKLHGMQWVKALIGLAVPGRPIGPWSRRTGAPKASATIRDRNPSLLTACSRDRPSPAGTARNSHPWGSGEDPGS